VSEARTRSGSAIEPAPDTCGRGAQLTQRLTSAERERRWPNVRPRDAATLIVLDRSGPEPKVLMGRRHAALAFMPGQFVFPGGRIEPGDRRMPAAGALHPRAYAALDRRVVRPSADRGRALALAAIRETFEETGLLIGTRDHGTPEAPDGPWAAFRTHGVFPDLEALTLVARAITPPRRPRRFDTRFFAVDRAAIVGEVPGLIGPEAELVELVWVDLARAAELQCPTITQVILDELRDRLAGGFTPELPIPFYYERRGRFVRELL
jgi:8-oxo-dGTP pyrophosphatase MutT (NUDIX family)